MHTRTQEKGAETDLDLPVSVQESPAEAWVIGGLLQGRGTQCSSACMGPSEGSHHYLHYLRHSLASGQTTGREHSPALNRKLDLRFTEHGLTHQNKTQFSLSQAVYTVTILQLALLLYRKIWKNY